MFLQLKDTHSKFWRVTHRLTRNLYKRHVKVKWELETGKYFSATEMCGILHYVYMQSSTKISRQIQLY